MSLSSDEDSCLTPKELRDQVSDAELSFIPEKSRENIMNKPSEVRSPVLPHMSTSSLQTPTKLIRVRANSVTLPAAQTNRRRTSSGVFQVDETRTLPELAEHTRSKSEGVEVNGRRKEKQNLSPTHSSRKRTSSGVFQTDDVGPPPKKSEHAKAEISKKNGRRKEEETTVKEQKTEREDKVIDKFDSEAKSVCVSAFKESDSWD